MKTGDRVQHSSGNFIFIGTLLGMVVDRKGSRLWAVEQDGSHYVQLFGEYSLKLLGPGDWFDGIAPVVAPPAPVKPEFPIIIHIPERAVPHGAVQVNGLRSRTKLNILPARPREALRSEFVKVQIDFAFTGTVVGDIDNLTKPILDLLKGSVIVDDGQVRELSCRVMPNQPVSSIKITLTAYEPQAKS